MASRQKRAGFGRLYKRPGRDGYYIRLRWRGKEITRWAGPDKRTAAEFQAKLLRTTAREDLLDEKAIAEVSFAEFEQTLLNHFRARHAPSTVIVETGRLRRIVKWFGSMALKGIGPGEVQDFLAHLRNIEGLSVAGANRYASLLSVAFKLAVEKGCARENPLRQVVRSREDVRPVPYISAEDVARLVAEARDDRFGAMLRILADTGLRRSEALALEWRDVDLARGLLIVRRSKNRRPRQVELTVEAQAAFRVLLDQRSAVPIKGPDLVWPEFAERNPQAVSSRFKTVARRAGFPHLRLHDLRHGFCSRLAQAGVPLPTISALAGHQSWLTTQRYASHVPEGATKAAIRAMERAGKKDPAEEGKAAGEEERQEAESGS